MSKITVSFRAEESELEEVSALAEQRRRETGAKIDTSDLLREALKLYLDKARRARKKSAPEQATIPGVQQPAPPEDPDYRRVVAAYFDAYERARGVKPPFGKREGRAVRELLTYPGEARAIEAIRACFADTWGAKNGSLFDVKNDPGRWIGRKPAQGTTQRERASYGRDVE